MFIAIKSVASGMYRSVADRCCTNNDEPATSRYPNASREGPGVTVITKDAPRSLRDTDASHRESALCRNGARLPFRRARSHFVSPPFFHSIPSARRTSIYYFLFLFFFYLYIPSARASLGRFHSPSLPKSRTLYFFRRPIVSPSFALEIVLIIIVSDKKGRTSKLQLVISSRNYSQLFIVDAVVELEVIL